MGDGVAVAGDTTAAAGGGVDAATMSTVSCGAAELSAAAVATAAESAWLVPSMALLVCLRPTCLHLGSHSVNSKWHHEIACPSCATVKHPARSCDSCVYLLCAATPEYEPWAASPASPGIGTVLGAYAKPVDSNTEATGGAAAPMRAERRTGVATYIRWHAECGNSAILANGHFSISELISHVTGSSLIHNATDFATARSECSEGSTEISEQHVISLTDLWLTASRPAADRAQQCEAAQRSACRCGRGICTA